MTKAVSMKAWRNVYQERTCPPYAVLIAPEQAGNVSRHRKGARVRAVRRRRSERL